MGEVEVNIEVLEEELNKLKKISIHKEKIKTIKSIGKCADMQKEIISYYEELNTCLSSIVESTINIVENAKDGFIEVEKSLEKDTSTW